MTMTTGEPGPMLVGVPMQTQQPKKEKHVIHWFRKGEKNFLI